MRKWSLIAIVVAGLIVSLILVLEHRANKRAEEARTTEFVDGLVWDLCSTVVQGNVPSENQISGIYLFAYAGAEFGSEYSRRVVQVIQAGVESRRTAPEVVNSLIGTCLDWRSHDLDR